MQKSKKLSEQLIDTILNCGKSRYEISKATGISEGTLSRFVHKHHGLSLDTVDGLAAYLGLKLVVDEARQLKKGK